MVYVISKDGQPLMPTQRYGKVRRMLKFGLAKVVRSCPFTIQLSYDADNNVQPVVLGIDAGSKVIGVSATTESKVMYEANVMLRTDVVDLLSTRRELRRSRRSRKTRYRKVRYENRVHSKNKGWLAPSVEEKIQTHLKVVADVHKILPLESIVVETAAFDVQMLKAKQNGSPVPEGIDYQRGEQMYFWNVREYVLYRDGHVCQCCKGKSRDKVLNVHHIESRKVGGNAPNNLVTLCETCHKNYHLGKIELPETIKRQMSYRDAAFMGIMRWEFYNRLKKIYPNVRMTYGYITKNVRIEHGLPKEHYVDARCISGHPTAETVGEWYLVKKVRCHNRKMHKNTIQKGGVRKRNQAPYLVKGYRLFDKVKYCGQTGFVFGRRTSGSFDIRTLEGERINAGVSYKKLTFIQPRKNYLIERRMGFPTTAKAMGFQP